MKVIVDTCIWSLALRHSDKQAAKEVQELKNLISDYRVQMIGPIRQEILSGIKSTQQYHSLRSVLRAFSDYPINIGDYELAAEFFNICRGKGIQGSNTDFLICSIAANNKLSVFTNDKDFVAYAKVIPVLLHEF